MVLETFLLYLSLSLIRDNFPGKSIRWTINSKPFANFLGASLSNYFHCAAMDSNDNQNTERWASLGISQEMIIYCTHVRSAQLVNRVKEKPKIIDDPKPFSVLALLLSCRCNEAHNVGQYQTTDHHSHCIHMKKRREKTWSESRTAVNSHYMFWETNELIFV